MKNIIDQLPPEIARQLHPDCRKNESGYWAVRDQLLETHRGKWIGFADGKVVASGTSPVTVFHAAVATGLLPFFICVGKEEEPCRIRRATFTYDTDYSGEPLPTVAVEFRNSNELPGVILGRVIPDTGADSSVLPWSDCQRLQLKPAQGTQALIGGVAGSSTATLSFRVWASLDGEVYPCRLQADFDGSERILGRDVLNRVAILFDGPNEQVVVNP